MDKKRKLILSLFKKPTSAKISLKHHVIISGTGRSGTTFLTQLLTELGLDTGFNQETLAANIYKNCHAGLELDIRSKNSPYIVKSPWLCDQLPEILSENRIVIDHAFIPFRDIFAAAESRRQVQNTTDRSLHPDDVPGGLWHTETPQQQEFILSMQFYKLIDVLTDHNIPMTFIRYPRLTCDPEYLYQQLGFLMKGISYSKFAQAFTQVVKPNLVHSYKNSQTA